MRTFVISGDMFQAPCRRDYVSPEYNSLKGTMPMRVFVMIASLIAASAAIADMSWEFDDPADLAASRCFSAVKVGDGSVYGHTCWDPSITMRVPEEGLDVRTLPFITVRMYSSADADVLSAYYKCSDGLWGLGKTIPVKKGWGVYRADLREAAWTEGGMQAKARQWGGVSKRIVGFRIDPGNQEGRWVVIDRVALTAEPTGQLGFEAEPRGTATNITIEAPKEITAGDVLKVKVSCEVNAPKGLKQLTAVVALGAGGTPTYAHQGALALSGTRASMTCAFPFSKYHPGGTYTVNARFLELDASAAEPSTVAVGNPLVGTRNPPVTKVADFRGDPALYVDGKAQPLITYVKHSRSAPHTHKEMAAAGIAIYTDWFGASASGDLGHTASGEYDYTAYDKYFADALDAVPNAYFLPHVAVVAPSWWQRQHPEECCLFSNGKRGPSSLFSELWRQEMGEDLKRLIAHLQQAPYADRILGYIFFSGYTAEWQMWGTWQRYSDDYSEPALKGFRAWLAREYKTPEALREAWHNPDVSFENAEVPSSKRRNAAGPFVLDPATDQDIIDYHQFTSDGVAESIQYFARVAKEAVADKQIVGTYYGYMAAHAVRQPQCGHNGLSAVLRCPDIDFLMSPPMYVGRELGGTSTFMSATESVRLHGKLWLDESDLRTYLTPADAGYGRTKTPEASVAACWREFANILTRRAAVSWFDMTGGWFSDKPMLDAYAQQMKVTQKAFPKRKPFAADVALFIDERSYANFRMDQPLHPMIRETIAAMPQAGVTWDFYLLSDLADPKLPDYKLYALLNTVELDEAAHKALMAKAARTKATILYMYAPGYVGRAGLRPGGPAQCTGMKVQPAGKGTAAYKLTADAVSAGFGAAEALLGPDLELEPRPVIADEGAQALARFADGAGVCLARKTVDGVPVYYCSSLAMPPALWRAMAQQAGAFVYCETDDAFYTDGQYAALHAASDGTKTIRLKKPAWIIDVMTGQCLAEKDTAIQKEMKFGETLFVELAPVEK